jgi:hypothetical protein
MKTLTRGAQRRLPFICEEEQPQEDSRLDPRMSGFRRERIIHRKQQRLSIAASRRDQEPKTES